MATDLNKGIRPSVKKDTIVKKKIPEIMSVEQKFIDIFGTKVQVKGSINKGKIEITYYSPDDLDRIYEIINK
jgi:ParB family chromosome partitioning protein